MRFLRGHHLICLHFYRGEGYNKAFVDALNRILKGVAEEMVEVVEGPDEVCQACPHLKKNQCSYKKGEEEIRLIDDLALSLLELNYGDRVFWEDIRDKLGKIFSSWRVGACQKCDWLKVCESTDLWKNLKS